MTDLHEALLVLAVEEEDPSLYTSSQEKLLFWIGKPTCVLGILGSFYICYCIARDAARRQQTFRRLLFSVSAGHILLCICMALLTIPMPRGTHYAAFGNEQSCRAMGFVTHWAFGFTLFGHGEMGFYYIFTFFRGWTERRFHEKIEPILHATAFLYPLLGAIIGISTNMYGSNELLLQCWVQTGAPGRIPFTFLAGLIELNYFTIFKQLSLIGIAYTVYKQERRMVMRYSVCTPDPSASINTTSNNKRVKRSTRGAVSTPQSALVARETLIQASIFFLSCFVPYAIMMIMRYYDLFWVKIPDDGKVPQYLFGLAAAAQFLYPLQGVIAMVGFIRPDYCKIRRGYHNETAPPFGKLLWQTILLQTGWGGPQDHLQHSFTPKVQQAPVKRQRKGAGSILAKFSKNLRQEIDAKGNSDITQSTTSHAAERESEEIQAFRQDSDTDKEDAVHEVEAQLPAASSRRKHLVREYTLSGFMDLSSDDDDEEEEDGDEFACDIASDEVFAEEDENIDR